MKIKVNYFKSALKIIKAVKSDNAIIPFENASFFSTFNNASSSLNFVLNDYLGLSNDERIRLGKIKGFRGSFRMSSNVEMLHNKAEEYLSWIFGRPVLLLESKDTVHTNIMPSIIDVKDAVVLDKDVHSSIRIATDILINRGVHVEFIGHNEIQILEERIKQLTKKYKKVWYLADSIYPMRGDTFPAAEIQNLLNTYRQFYLYIDDSKGLSWTGENGKGYVCARLENCEKFVLSASLSKGFGCEGGLLVCYDETIKKKIIRNLGRYNSQLTSTHLESIIESAKIHLSNEIYGMQEELKQRVSLFNKVSHELGLPIVSSPDIPSSFFAIGLPGMCQEICFNLLKCGYYLNMASFPMVPEHSSGIMANVTLWQSKTNIKEMLNVFRSEYHKAIKRRNLEPYDVLRNYGKHALIS
jgi:7-keto-8-aminopelargonate synthetase-like enzyme